MTLTRKTPLRARKPMGTGKSPAQKARDAERKAREYARKYGSTERAFYVAQLACVVPWCRSVGWMENAHIETGGVGRKADASKVVPCCARHHRTGPIAMHAGVETFQDEYGIDLEEAARLTEESWQRYGAEVVARAKADGRFDRWLARRNPEHAEEVA